MSFQRSYMTLQKFGNAFLKLPSLPYAVGYIVAVLVLPRIIRKPVPEGLMKPVMIIYNLCVSLLSLWTAGEFVTCLVQHGTIFGMYETVCRTGFTLYYWSKAIELCDTLWMILRCKSRQLSFLHVYHHSSMLLLADLALDMSLWSSVAFILAINSLVHVYMYFYYFLAALGQSPSWKKSVTKVQMYQFVIAMVHTGYGYLHYGFCRWGPIYAASMILLFSDFWSKTYTKRKTS